MGNQIATDLRPCSIEDLVTANSQHLEIEQPSISIEEKTPIYSNFLLFWQFFPDGKDDLFIHNQPINLNTFTGFEDESCYVVLHIYLKKKKRHHSDALERSSSLQVIIPNKLNPNEIEKNNNDNNDIIDVTVEVIEEPKKEKNNDNCTDSSKSSSSEDNLVPASDKNNQLSIIEFVVSAQQQLTPRGQSSSFGGIHSFFNTIQISELNKKYKYKIQYDVYVWYGKEALQIVKANALAKAFDLEGSLKKSNFQKFLQYFYFKNESIVPLSSLFQFCHSLSLVEWNRLITENHLFTTISKAFNSNHRVSQTSSTTSATPSNSASMVNHLKNHAASTSSLVSSGPAQGNYTSSSPEKRTTPKRERIKKLSKLSTVTNSPPSEEKRKEKEKKEKRKKRRTITAKNVSLAKLETTKDEKEKEPKGGSKVKFDNESKPTTSTQQEQRKLKEKLNFRSISMPAAEIARVRDKVKMMQLDLSFVSDTESLKIDLSNLRSPTSPKVSTPSKAQKIALFDKICSEITNYLYLGSDSIAQDFNTLNQFGITHILNCAATICKNYHPDKFQYKELYLFDGTRENISCLFYEVLEFLDDAISSGGKVFVHCHQGISRSSAMVILYLMWKDKREYQFTHERVKAIRDVANPNAGFTCQLLNWWDHRTENHLPKFYTVLPHYEKTPSLFMLKELPKEEISTKSLDRRGCFLLWDKNIIYIWVGKECTTPLKDGGERYAKRLQRFENAPNYQIEYQGSESSEFIESIGGDSQTLNDVQTIPIYDESFKILKLLPREDSL